MTPVPLELPLRPSEAAELANLIFDQAERKPLTDEVRNRVAARAAVLKLETITPWSGSLERDPVHPGAYYLAVDGVAGSPHLLYMALATAPTSSIFYKPLLIGRMRRANGPELVINATPFGAEDRGNIELFVSKIDTAFLPRVLGSRAEIAVEENAAAAFDVFRSVHKRSGKNVAALAGDYHAGLWAAIRAGWRLGYAAITDVTAGSTVEEMRGKAAFTRFAVDVSAMEAYEPALKAAEQVHEQIRQARALLKISAAFEFEVRLPEVTAADLEFCLDWLRARGHAAQLAAPAKIAGDIAEAAEVARRHQAALSIRYPGADSGAIQEAARAPLGRVSFRVRDEAEASRVAEYLFA
ncbi:MAG TPA: hypothetical protein VMH28_15575 [Candidatus Acidoferrales bacterium]|nr:hypothetical protein [Candidatus Acidoferrales bacterium]